MNPLAATAATPITPGSTLSAETKAKLKDKADQFEQFFIQQFISLMTPETDEHSIMNGGIGEKAFTKNLQEQMAKAISNGGGFGVSSKVYGELLRAQEMGTGIGAASTAFN